MKKLLLVPCVLAASAMAFSQASPEVQFSVVTLPTDGTTAEFQLPKFVPKGRKLTRVETNVYFDSTLTLTLTAPAGGHVYQVLGESTYTLPHLGTFTSGIASKKRKWLSDGQSSSITYNEVNFGNNQVFTESKQLAHFLGSGNFTLLAGAKFWCDTDSTVNWSIMSVPPAQQNGTNAVLVVRYFYN